MRKNTKNKKKSQGKDKDVVKVSFSPHTKQWEFLNSDGEVVFFIAGVGTGKTLLGAWAIILRALKYPESEHLIAAPTLPMLRQAGLKKILEILAEYPEFRTSERVWHNKNEKWFKLVNGSLIHYGSLDNPETLRGSEYASFWFDEIAYVYTSREPDKGLLAIENIAQRMRGYDKMINRYPKEYADFNYKGFCTTTPKGKNWLYRILVKEKEKYDTYDMIHCPTHVNAHNLPKNYIANLKRTYTPSYYSQEVLAEFTDFEGKVFKEFKNDHIISKKTILNKIREGEIEGFYLGKDWGKTDNGVSVIIGVGRTKEGYTKYYLMEEIVKSGVPAVLPYGTDGQDWISMDMALVDKYRAFGLKYYGSFVETADPTGANISYSRNGFELKKVKKSREGSVQVIASFFFGDRFYICEDCEESIDEFDNYSRDGNGLLEDGNDHCINAISYVLYNLEHKNLIKMRKSYEETT